MPTLHSPITRSPIAVFDSGLGGLTVVKALRDKFPTEDIVYFGDTARVPYGNKSAETVLRFTREICQFLLYLQPKCIIAACNTASAVALPAMHDECPVPLIGVVTPIARQAAHITQRELIAVLGTEATIASGAYERAIRALNPQIRVVQQSCPLFVPIIEEGRLNEDPITQQAIRDYLSPIRRLRPDVVLLGCTHYPILKPALQEFFSPDVTLLDSGDAVTQATLQCLQERDLLYTGCEPGTVQCYVSDFPQRFSALATRFLGEPLPQVARANVEFWQRSSSANSASASA